MLTPDGGISTVWEDSKDTNIKYEIVIDPKTAKGYIDYANLVKENVKESKESE
jgi:hypothetical protein